MIDSANVEKSGAQELQCEFFLSAVHKYIYSIAPLKLCNWPLRGYLCFKKVHYQHISCFKCQKLASFCDIKMMLVHENVTIVWKPVMLQNAPYMHILCACLHSVCVSTCEEIWQDAETKTETHQVNEVTEVLLDLLRRQTPHQVQGTVQLLVTLKHTQAAETTLITL